MYTSSVVRPSTQIATHIVRRAPIRALGFAVALAVIVAMLAPLAPLAQSAAAADDDQTELAVAETTDETLAPEEGSTEEAATTADQAVATDAQFVAAQPGSSGLFLNKWECIAPYGRHLDQLLANCAVVNNVEFQVYSADAGYQETFQGGFSLQAMPAGNYTIRELIPQGYAEPIVFCGFGPTNEQQPAQSEVVTYDGYYEFALAVDQSIYCNWFNVPFGENPSIVINKHYCPADFDAYSADIYGLAENCHGQEPNVRFSVLDANFTELATDMTGSQGLPGLVEFTELPTVLLSIAEDPLEGYGQPIVTCKVMDAAGYHDGFQSFDVSFDGFYYIQWQAYAGLTLYCDWFNVFDPDYDGGTYGSVTVVKYTCYDETSYDHYDYEDFAETCPETTEGVNFKLDGASTGNPGDYPTDANGTVTWGEREADHYYLYEELPTGYGAPAIFCGYYDPAALTTAEREYDAYEPEYTPDADPFTYRIEFDLDEGQHFICLWYNVPTYEDHEDYGSVTVIKYTCHEATDDHDLDWLAETCPETTEGVNFKLDGDSTGNPGDYPTDENGEVRWDEREADHYYLYEELPTGYGAPVVYCGSDEDYDGYTAESTPDADPFDYRVEFDLDEGEHVVCLWFNIPAHEDEYSDFSLVKWVCPEGYTYEDLYDYELHELEEVCTEVFEGVDFELDGPDGYDDDRETDEQGQAAWGELETGEYELQEDVPNGYGDPIVWCGFSAYYNGAIIDGFPQRVDLSGGDTFEFEIEIPSSKWFCFWFNIPDYDGEQHKDEYGTITIVKYWCDGDYVAETNCELYGGGQAFELIPVEGGESIELTTGPNGSKTIEVPAGEWDLDEVDARWCLAKSPDVSENGYLFTEEGHETVVWVYNCGDRPDGEQPTGQPSGKRPPTQLPNTGSGEAAGTLTIAGMTGGAETIGILMAVGQIVALAGLAINRRRTAAESRPAA